MTTAPVSWVGLDLENDRYHVTAALGEGGMAHIYRAFDRKKQWNVVLKVPKPALLADPEFVHRFAREVKTLVELKHPSIVAVLGFGRHLGFPFAVLEYMAGGTLDDRTKPCEPHELSEWIVDIGAALDHIHAKGYVHRDVKPSNILFDDNGRARLSDFGIIKSIDEKVGQTRALTESGVAVGTPEYMAPELARGESYDGKVDQYALAVTVYEMLAGRRPIVGGSGPVILVKQIQETPLPLNEVDAAISTPLAASVSRGLAKDPRHRFTNCSEFAQIVCKAVDDRPARANVHVRSVGTNHQANGSTTNSIRFWWITSLVFCSTIAVGALSWLLMPTKPGMLPGNNLTANDPNANRPAPVVSNHFTISAVPVTAIVGKQHQIVVRVDRIGSWSGPVNVQLIEPPSDCDFQRLATTIPADASECQFRFTPRRPIKDVTLKFIGTADHSNSIDTTTSVSARAATFSIAPFDSIDMTLGESRFVSIFLNRDGFDDTVDLIVRPSSGVRAEPTNVHFDAGVNEASVKLTATTAGKAAAPVRLMYNGQEKARFDVRVIATSITPVKPNQPKKSDNDIGQLVTREAGTIVGLAFHPKDPTILAIWTERGWINLWDLETKARKCGQHLSTAGTRGTFSADGRQIVTCGSNLVHLMNNRGETVSQGPSSHRILGVYYDGQFPHFWTANGICNYLGKLIQPNSPGKNVTKIKYATIGATHSIRDFDGKVQWRSGQSVQTWEPMGLIDDFAISHDGRWVAVAANGKVWIQDTSQADSKPLWSKDLANVSAIAIAPSGKQLAIGLTTGEVRLVSVESSP